MTAKAASADRAHSINFTAAPLCNAAMHLSKQLGKLRMMMSVGLNSGALGTLDPPFNE